MHDFIFAVENNHEWHKENFINNKGHYQLIPRHTFKHRMVSFFQQYGAKIHFNYLKNEKGEVNCELFVVSEIWSHRGGRPEK